MKCYKLVLFLSAMCLSNLMYAQMQLTETIALDLSRAPLHCIPQEFPNKTSHLSDGPEDAKLLPSELHPVFYGCLDWHSSVHGHWMLVRLLQEYPNIPNRDSIINVLNNSFVYDKMVQEAGYFGKYTASQNYERTYGWAWLLKLDETLGRSKEPMYVQWRLAMQPLTSKIVTLWKDYLPKQTYPNRTGVHSNAAFGLDFALDWARFMKDTTFENNIIDNANRFYATNQNIPGYLEPDGSDFFSPSLMAAMLMSKIMDTSTFNDWFNKYYTVQSIEQLCTLPTVSDRNDYQIVHLDGLAFSRAWCMRTIAPKLNAKNIAKKQFEESANSFLKITLPQIFESYGGEHWLASFAIFALLES